MPSSSVPDRFRRGVPERERRVHVEVAVDEGGGDEAARDVELLAASRLDLLADRLDLAVLDQDVDALAAVGEVGPAQDQVRLHGG
jgi:hypothetical protein